MKLDKHLEKDYSNFVKSANKTRLDRAKDREIKELKEALIKGDKGYKALAKKHKIALNIIDKKAQEIDNLISKLETQDIKFQMLDNVTQGKLIHLEYYNIYSFYINQVYNGIDAEARAHANNRLKTDY